MVTSTLYADQLLYATVDPSNGVICKCNAPHINIQLGTAFEVATGKKGRSLISLRGDVNSNNVLCKELFSNALHSSVSICINYVSKDKEWKIECG